MVIGGQPLCRIGVLDRLANPVPDEVRGRRVRLEVDADVGERAVEAEPAEGPAILEDRLPLLIRDLEGRLGRGLVREPRDRVAGNVPDLVVALLDVVEVVPVHRVVTGRDGELRGALEDREVLRLLGDHGNRLDAAGTGADHADALPGEVDTVVRPGAGVERFALERVAARDIPGSDRRRGSRCR